MANANQLDGTTPKKSNRGFASMDAARQREIASQGGRAAHQKGTAHEFTSEEARAAGSKSHKSGRALNRSSAAGGSADRPDSAAGASRGDGVEAVSPTHPASRMREGDLNNGTHAIESEASRGTDSESPASA